VPAIVIAVLVLGVLALRTTLQIEKARQQTVLDATATLATERVDLLDNQIVAQDNVVAAHADVSDLGSLTRRWLATASRETPTVRGILVVDMTYESHDVLAFATRSPGRSDDTFRRMLLLRLFRAMNFEGRTEELRHLHESIDDVEYLVSYWQRSHDGRRYMVVVWHDVDRIVHELMPQLYRDPDRGNARMNVVDEKGRIVFGPPIKVGDFGVSRPFPTTLYNWRLQLALTSADELGQKVERRRLFELGMVVVAGLVAVLGLFVVINASLKERRLGVLKSDFVANVSHELKTPLALIRMFGELLLLDRVKSQEKRKQYYQIIVSESERLTALIENVLDFARVERGKVAYDFVDGDVGEVVRRAVEIYRYRAEREGVVVEATIEPDLPLVRVDPRALELAFLNLVDNAIKYAREGQRIDVEVSVVDDDVHVRVADRGPGIPKDEQPRIFERFFRGRSAGASHARGSGIGLALVRHIAQSHGGDVVVESPISEDGRGTAFTLTLPIPRGRGARGGALASRPSLRPSSGGAEPQKTALEPENEPENPSPSG
jgi:two-component system phosphate regulon sensor histidine kinase PhoR